MTVETGARTFRLPERPSFQELAAATVHRLAAGRPCRVLEAGCGPRAPVSSVLAGVAGFELVCCDIDEPKTKPAGTTFRAVDLGKPLPFDDASFDVVCTTEVIEHLKNPFYALEEFGRILKPKGHLVFTIPNFWNIRRRMRYLLTGNLQNTHYFTHGAREDFRRNACPHINTTTLPTYEYALASYGMRITGLQLRGHRAGEWIYWPIVWAIQLLNMLRGAKRRRKFMLAHTNHARILTGGEHIMFVCEKVGFDQVPYEIGAWETLGDALDAEARASEPEGD